MNVVVGCPFSDRGWIFDKWVEHVIAAFANANCEPRFVFVASSENKEDIKLLNSLANAEVVLISEPTRSDVRSWKDSRYHHMVNIRNILLSKVRDIEPELFLSLDSDILLAPDSISSALDALNRHRDAWAVGLKCYMSSTTTTHPSFGAWADSSFVSFRRDDTDDIATVDIIMAAKLMKPEAYNINYSYHRNGEDLGWSLNLKNSGGSLIWDGRVVNKHIMDKNAIHNEDKRVGF
jgi:hypothetical protein